MSSALSTVDDASGSYLTPISRLKRTFTVEQAENILVIPPDGGWGWVVTVTAFVVNFVVDGVFYAFGIFLDDISVSFKVSTTRVALASPIMTGFFYSLGPIVCAVINRYGYRVVGVAGGLIAACAFLVSSFLYDIWLFLVILGVFVGCGGGMIYIASVIAVGFYFAKWRALAMAAAASGTALGMVAFPPLMTNLFGQLHWRTKFQILAAMFSFCSLCAMTWKPVEPVVVEEDKKVKFREHEVHEHEPSTYSDLTQQDSETKLLQIYRFFRKFQTILFPTVAEEGKSIVTYDIKSLRDESILAFNMRPSVGSIPARSFFSRRSATTIDDDDEGEHESKLKRCCSNYCGDCCCGVTYNRPLYRDDIFFPGSVYTLPQYSKLGPSKQLPMSYHKRVTRVATTVDLLESTRCVCCPEAFVRGLASMLNFQLLKSPAFFLLLLSGFFTALGMYSPYIFVIQRADDDFKIDKTWSVMMLSIIGLANITGRILCGFVSFSPKLDALIISYLTMIFCGISIIASCFMPTLWGQIIFVVVFGLNIASLPVLRPVVIVDLFGLEQLTNGFGLNVLFQGLACFAGVPISGFLYDYTGKYEATFLFSGCAILLSGLLMIPVKRLCKWENDKKSRRK